MQSRITGPGAEVPIPHMQMEQLVPLSAMSDEQFRALCESILVVVPYRMEEGVDPGVCQHFGIWGRLSLRYSTLRDPHGGFVEIVRGHAERVFLDLADQHPEIKYLVMIDNDQAIDWDAPLRLAAHDLPVVSGIVCGFSSERGVFACIMVEDDNGTPRYPTYRFTKRFPGRGIREVYGCGTGLICIRRDVIETLVARGEQAFMIPEHLRRESYRTGVIKQGEDFSFCDKARAAGFDIWVDFGVRAYHFKTIPLAWPDDKVDDELDANDWTVSSLDFRGLKDQR